MTTAIHTRSEKSGRRAQPLTRIIHEASAAATHPGMSAALRSVGFLDALSSAPAESSLRAPAMPMGAASRRTFMNNAGSWIVRVHGFESAPLPSDP